MTILSVAIGFLAGVCLSIAVAAAAFIWNVRREHLNNPVKPSNDNDVSHETMKPNDKERDNV